MQAIHPGYGFLAENAHFAEVCRSCNIEFIGPPHEAMALVGDKNAARKMAKQVGRAHGARQRGPDGRTRTRPWPWPGRSAFPVLVKAVGRRRRPRDARGLGRAGPETAIKQAQAEAEAAFGCGDVYLEKYVEHPRHVEVQVLGDAQGNVVHLWERDCTMQRRHQKLIEESPAPRPRRRRSARPICESAVRLVKVGQLQQRRHGGVHRRPAGHFYFIEVNARIQVEHPVTRDGHRDRPDQGPDPRGGGRAAALQAGGYPSPRGGHRVPHQRGRPHQRTSAPRRARSAG